MAYRANRDRSMKTHVAPTSIEVYHDIRYEGLFNRQQKIILELMDWSVNYSLQELCVLTRLPINVISGRVFELKEKNLIQHADKRKCRITRRTIQSVRLCRAQPELF